MVWLACWLAPLLAGLGASAEDWPQFRGPTGQGLSTETGLPLHWSVSGSSAGLGSNIVWKTPIPGEGWSSPIITGNCVWVTTATEGGTDCHVVRLDRETGKMVWDKVVFQQTLKHKEGRNSYATPTPATDGERVYAVFADGSFVALDLNGTVVWTNRDLPHYSQHGLGTSPILWKDLLIMARDGSHEGQPAGLGWQTPWDKSYVVALDKHTGKVRWKSSRGSSRIAHVVPVIWTDASGRSQLISSAGDVVQGFDPVTGDRIWSSSNQGEGVVPSPAVGDGLVFVTSGFSGRDSLKAFRLGERGDLKETNLAWEQRKGMPKVPSLLYVSPHLYTLADGGLAMCLKGDSGEILWQERLDGSYSASPVHAEGRIYYLADNGQTTVIEAKPEFKVLARSPLGEKCQASMAVSNRRLFIRGEKHVYCVAATGP